MTKQHNTLKCVHKWSRIKLDHLRRIHVLSHLSHLKLWSCKMYHDWAKDLHWLGAKSDKAGQSDEEGEPERERKRGEGFVSLPQDMGLSLPVKQQQQNKSETYGMTNSRLWHPSDPKHVLIISPWLPVGVDVISTCISQQARAAYKLLLGISDSGLRGLEWSNKSYKRIQIESLSLSFPQPFSQICNLWINI